jgi:hypothetical protein
VQVAQFEPAPNPFIPLHQRGQTAWLWTYVITEVLFISPGCYRRWASSLNPEDDAQRFQHMMAAAIISATNPAAIEAYFTPLPLRLAA